MAQETCSCSNDWRTLGLGVFFTVHVLSDNQYIVKGKAISSLQNFSTPFHNTLMKGLKDVTDTSLWSNLLKRCGSYYSYSSNVTPHTNLIMKVYSESLFLFNTAPIAVVLSIVIPTQEEPDLISEKCMFWVEETVMYCLQWPVTKMRSSLLITIFNCLNLSNFIQV
jgi:hypothetical protein